ncbi:MAG: Tex family protein [Lachnospira sp.]
MDITKKIAEELQIKPSQVDAAIKLIDEGCTIPFIARYRKEVTGSLNDEQLRELDERLKYLRNLENRKEQVIASIEEQGKLTEDLKNQIIAAETMVLVEDLYRPYKQKRRTRAIIAKEKGLEPLALYILQQDTDKPVEEKAAEYISDEEGKEVASAADAIAGALDIIAEQISDEADYRTYIRDITFKEGKISSVAKDAEAESVYETYYDYSESLTTIPGHRVLALNRGENEKFLNVKIEAPVERILGYLEKKMIVSENQYTTPLLKAVVKDAYDRLIAPAIEREIRNSLTETAEDGAIKVFGKNLEQLLLQPPIAGKVVLGWDPAFRTGCKLAVVDPTGKVLATKVIYPTEPHNKVEQSKAEVKKLIDKYGITLISCGNGTASRESEKIIADMINEEGLTGVDYIITNEAGASVYSASKLATEEFPDFDVAQRSAVSIARRVQDPLAELVKIEPKSIGVGQYQHDMNQKKLGEALAGVVEDSVNKVGVDLNTASASLLEYISGISKTVAKNIVDYRETNGRFTNRKQLLKVAKLGPKAFEQCAGFMRIQDGDNPLDATSVHPESYEVAKKLLEIMGYDINSITTGELIGLRSKIKDIHEMAQKLDVGEITLDDIIKELEKPGRDPREDMPKPILRKDVLDMKDLQPGMILKGTVRNVIDFGAFVDIGVHQDGLVHISQMTRQKRVEHPLDVVSVGDIVDVRVVDVDVAKARISLSMILDENEAAKKVYDKKPADKKSTDKKAVKGTTDRHGRTHGNKQRKNTGLNLNGLSKFMR